MKFNFNKKADFNKENLDNIWVVDMWLDNMDSKDGHDHIEFTKIGLIDFLNNEMEDYNSTNGADFTALDRNATNKEVEEVLYDLFEGKVVEIKPYNEKSANKKVRADRNGEKVLFTDGDWYVSYSTEKTGIEDNSLGIWVALCSAADNTIFNTDYVFYTDLLSEEDFVDFVNDSDKIATDKLPDEKLQEYSEKATEMLIEKLANYKEGAEEEPKEKIDVLFKFEQTADDKIDIVAWFVNEPDTCYSHFGQHSSCDPKYMASLEDADFESYEYTLKELESIGYEVNVMNSDYKQQKKASRKFTFIKKKTGEEKQNQMNESEKKSASQITDSVKDYFKNFFKEKGYKIEIIDPDTNEVIKERMFYDANEAEIYFKQCSVYRDKIVRLLNLHTNNKMHQVEQQIIPEKPFGDLNTASKKRAGEETENYITVWLYPGSGASLYGFATVADNEEEALENVADYLVEKQLHSFYMTPQEYQDFMKDFYDDLSQEELEEKMENDETVMYVDTGRGAVVYLTGFENAKIEKGINESYIDDIAIIDGSRAKSGPLSKWSSKSASKKVKADKQSRIYVYNINWNDERNKYMDVDSQFPLLPKSETLYESDFPHDFEWEHIEEVPDYIMQDAIEDILYKMHEVQPHSFEYEIKATNKKKASKKVQASAQVMSYTRKGKDEFVVKVADKEKDITADITVKVVGNDLSFDSNYQFPQDDDETLEDFIDTAVWFLVNKKLINFDNRNRWNNGKASLTKKADWEDDEFDYAYYLNKFEKIIYPIVKQTSLPIKVGQSGKTIFIQISNKEIADKGKKQEFEQIINQILEQIRQYKPHFTTFGIKGDNDTGIGIMATDDNVGIGFYNEKSFKASLKRKAGTGNFATQEGYPLIAIGDEQVYPIKSYIEDYNENNPEEPITEENMEDHYEDYGDILTDLYREVTNEMETYLKNADIPYGWNITIESGYYEGAQLYVEEPDDFEYNFENDWLYDNELAYGELTPEQKAELQNATQAQFEKEKAQVIQIMHDAAKACGWLELAVAYRFSNGETGYSIVK